MAGSAPRPSVQVAHSSRPRDSQRLSARRLPARPTLPSRGSHTKKWGLRLRAESVQVSKVWPILDAGRYGRRDGLYVSQAADTEGAELELGLPGPHEGIHNAHRRQGTHR